MNAASLLLRAYFDICRLRLRPQDLPASGVLMLATLGSYWLCSFLVSLLLLPAGQAFITTVVNLILLILITEALLRLAGFRARVGQTLTALTGSGLVLNLLALPVVFWSMAARSRGVPSGGASLLHIMLLIWSLMVSAHIFRHALSTRFAGGLLIALAGLVLTWAVTLWVVPDAATNPA